MDLNIIRGTTNILRIIIEDTDRNPYTLSSTDKIIFGVKSNTENDDYVIYKTLTSGDIADGNCDVCILPEDTADLPFAKYFFDVGLQTADGGYYMLIPCSCFNVCKAVTQKEASK